MRTSKRRKARGTGMIQILDFVDYDEIDPIYFERTYYVGPNNGAEKVYVLLLQAMEEAGLAAIAKYVMRDQQQLGCLRVRTGVITLEKMYFADEIRPIDEIKVRKVNVGRTELRLAAEVIDQFRGPFEIGKYRDDYRRSLLKVIRAKAKGEEVEVEGDAPEEEKPDLLEALRASIESARSTKRPRHRASGNGDLSALPKAELVKQAKETGVTGYSHMTKAQLAKAIAKTR